MRLHRRSTDLTNWPLTLVGLLVISGAILLKVYTNASDYLILGLASVGGTIIPGSHIAAKMMGK